MNFCFWSWHYEVLRILIDFNKNNRDDFCFMKYIAAMKSRKNLISRTMKKNRQERNACVIFKYILVYSLNHTLLPLCTLLTHGELSYFLYQKTYIWIIDVKHCSFIIHFMHYIYGTRLHVYVLLIQCLQCFWTLQKFCMYS